MSALLAAGEGGGFEAPGPLDFWQPLAGGDTQYALTRPMVVAVLSVVLISWWLLRVTRTLTVVPGRAQYCTEGVYGMVRNGLARDILGTKDFLKFVPLLFTIFTLILVNNLFGIVPLIQFPTMSRIGFPLALAIVVYAVYHGVGIQRMGLAGYFKHMVPPGLPGWITPLIFFLELITYFVTRPVTLALRLFGNMFAGHILLVLCVVGGEYLLFDADGVLKIAGIAAFAGGFVMTLFEGFVQFLQAYVFTLLSALYIAGALADEH
ncbi:MAG: synthase subunit [Actinomycetota bacterium]|nr:synthase subunit [Actinomycetota bacterium]